MNKTRIGWMVASGAALVAVAASCSSGGSRGGGAGATAGTVGQGGSGAKGGAPSGGAPAGGSGGGIGSDGGPINTGTGQLLPFFPDSAGITLAIDGAGALHVAALANAGGKTAAVYA